MALGESGIDGEPELSALLRGRNDSALRPGCGFLGGGHAVFLVVMYLTAHVYGLGR
jgi:hypothetical protein